MTIPAAIWSRNFAGRIRRPLSSRRGSYVPRNKVPPPSYALRMAPLYSTIPHMRRQPPCLRTVPALNPQVSTGGEKWRETAVAVSAPAFVVPDRQPRLGSLTCLLSPLLRCLPIHLGSRCRRLPPPLSRRCRRSQQTMLHPHQRRRSGPWSRKIG